VAVCTDDLALLHLVENILPPPLGEVPRDLKRLLAFLLDVVEFEHHWVALSAVDARMGREELEQKESALNATQLFLDAGLRDVSALVSEVVLAVISGVAWTTHVVSLALGFASPREARDGLSFTAAPASAQLSCHEHMFASAADGIDLDSARHGAWRSLVAHSAGGRAVAGSNPVAPIAGPATSEG
jgi:hypothetical protein